MIESPHGQEHSERQLLQGPEREIQPKLYSIIMWYQQHYPQDFYGSSEIAGYLIEQILKHDPGERRKCMQQFILSHPSEQQELAAQKLVTFHHRKSGIKQIPILSNESIQVGEEPVIPQDQITNQVFYRTREQGIGALVTEIQATPWATKLESMQYNDPYPVQYNGKRILEFIEKGGEWVTIVKTACVAAGDALRKAPQTVIQNYQQGKIWERAHGYRGTGAIPIAEQRHSSIPAVHTLENLQQEARQRAVYASVSPEFIVDNYIALETFLHGVVPAIQQYDES